MRRWPVASASRHGSRPAATMISEAAAPLLETVQQRWDGTIGPLRDLTFVPLLDLGDRFLPDAPQQELAGERRFVRRHEMRCNFARAPAGDDLRLPLPFGQIFQ